MTHLPNAEVFTPRDSSSIDAWAAWFDWFLSENLSDGDLPPIPAEGKGSRPDLRGDGYLTDIAWEAQVLKQCRSHRPSDAGSVPCALDLFPLIKMLQYAGELLGRPGSGADDYHEIVLSEIHAGLGFFIRDARLPERADRSLDGEPENR